MLENSLRLIDVVLERRGSEFRLGPITYSFGRGVTAVVGVNGAGESTLFAAISGVERITGGVIHRPVGGAGQEGWIGFLPQGPVFPPSATVDDVLRLLSWTVGVADPAQEVARVSAQLDLDELRRKKVKHLSGGMLRRLGIAQAMIGSPNVLLLDEPTAGLDPIQRISVREAIMANCGDVVTLVSTHLVEDVRSLADRVLVLNQGAMVFAGSVQELEALAPLTPSNGESRLESALTRLYLGGSTDA